MPVLFTRRQFALTAAGTVAAIPLTDSFASAKPAPAESGFVNLHRPPDVVRAFTDSGEETLFLASKSSGRWTGKSVAIFTEMRSEGLAVVLSAPLAEVKRLHLRWQGRIPTDFRFLGDAWERAYGELEWRGIVPERVMPWYFLAGDTKKTHGYGVMTGPGAFVFWQVDTDGISLWADVRSGGVGVRPGTRTIDVCTVVSREGTKGETSFAALRDLCKQMCPRPRPTDHTIYGHNDWNFSYGRNSADSTREVAHRLLPLCPQGSNRPYIVIDDGWEPDGKGQTGRWDRGNEKFPDMPGLAAELKAMGARPGIWIKPTTAWDAIPQAWRLPRGRGALDPTVPEARQQIASDIARLSQWGYELIKHDFSTYDLMGRFGNDMGTEITSDNWKYSAGQGQTNAEVLRDLYQLMRQAAGNTVLLGCNTFSHLSAGIFEANRIGDDTSGQSWERTHRMGINCLGFRSAQNQTFYAADPDIVAVTKRVPWEKTRQWLDLVSRSGSVLFLSLEPSAVGPEQEAALKEALARAATKQTPGEPLDWQATSSPQKWRFQSGEKNYNWQLPTGVSPFRV